MFTLEDVRAALPAARFVGLSGESVEPLTFTGAIHDSRLAQAGTLFVAIKADRDGHDFVADAQRRGALGALVAHPVQPADPHTLTRSHSRAPAPPFVQIVVADPLTALQDLGAFLRRRLPLRVVGVTGSVGKTSTKEAIAAVLERRYQVRKNEANYNNEIGLPLTLIDLEPELECAVLEMGMYDVGEIARLCELAQPTIGVVTNVGPVHLERLGTIERIAQAKGELVAALPADGWALLNADDQRVRGMASRTKAQVVTFGFGATADLRATDVAVRGLDGVTFTLHWREERRPIASPALGRHSVYAALAAAGVALVDGLSLDEVVGALGALPPGLRLNVLAGRNGSRIIDDTYNASPASVIAALDLLATLDGRKVAVLGDMYELGSAEESGHREVGRRAAEVLDALYAVGPRARWIGEEARTCGLAAVETVAAKPEVSYEPQPGDSILVKGSRGMRMEEVVARLAASAGR
ncbi:MAG: UDP-N-acetylmuramoyl-tripeptide--D-alanyl-D-alanine ligase [Chloroflexi bacterium]|nr:UDP-N-acetylmuramoyl-tripeptide--D-alanyl-D-alanine ligase [Chloroflexota bacterium]